jgi:hypothetical protein
LRGFVDSSRENNTKPRYVKTNTDKVTRNDDQKIKGIFQSEGDGRFFSEMSP